MKFGHLFRVNRYGIPTYPRIKTQGPQEVPLKIRGPSCSYFFSFGCLAGAKITIIHHVSNRCRGTTLISRLQTVAVISQGWRNPRLPLQQLRNAAGLCLDGRTVLSCFVDRQNVDRGLLTLYCLRQTCTLSDGACLFQLMPFHWHF